MGSFGKRRQRRRMFSALRVRELLLPVGAAAFVSFFGVLFFSTAGKLLPYGAMLLYGGETAVSSPTAALPVEGASLPEEFTLLQKEEEPVLSPAPEEIIPAVTEEPPVIPEENKALLVYKTYTASAANIYLPLEHGFIKNCTKLPLQTVQQAIAAGPAFSLEHTGDPEVLIMHTHTTESYLPFPEGAYDTTYATRSTNNSKNMAAVGAVLTERLEELGVAVLHDVTQHDHPSYNGSYDRSRETVQRYLQQYPSIKVVLDVHRDAILTGDTAVAPVAEIGGKTAAQIMVISGCDDGSMNYPNYLQNLGFAAALQNELEKSCPGLTRPVLFDYRKYNQDLTSGSLLIEIGSHANTLEQAVYSAELLAEVLGRLLA